MGTRRELRTTLYPDGSSGNPTMSLGAAVMVDSPWTTAPSAVTSDRKADIWDLLALPSRLLKSVERVRVLFVADAVR